MGTGLGHYIPIVAYLGFWIMCLVSLTGRPLLGLYYLIPFLPYRTMRDHFMDYPLGAQVVTILLLCVILGALLSGKHVPKSKLFALWFAFGAYLYVSMWIGTAMGNAPPPLWLGSENFVTWKDYMLLPLLFFASGLVIEDRKAIRTIIILTAISVVAIDRSCLMESMSRTWTNFDEDKRSGGPLGFGSNQTAAFLAQFAMFFYGTARFIQRRKYKLLSYGISALTLFAMMYTFSRGSYLAALFGFFVVGLVNDRKVLVLLGVFLLTWQTIVPVPVRERVNMTKDAHGQLEASAQERVDLWENAQRSFLHSPIVGNGFATFQYGEHVDNLKDTHNWYVKVLVETGVVGFIFVIFMLGQMVGAAYRLYRKATDPLYKGLGLGLLLAICACLVANIFGDRWTYIEITSLLWVLTAAALRALQLTLTEVAPSSTEAAVPLASGAVPNPFLAYR